MNPETILVVDDAPAILSSLSGILMDEGYDAQIASGGAEALQMVTASPPALVLLDIWMPDLDGVEVLRQIRRLSPETMVIMMSGHGSIETAVKTIKIGAYDYLEKPVSLEKVVMLVKHAMAEQRLASENRTLKRRLGPGDEKGDEETRGSTGLATEMAASPLPLRAARERFERGHILAQLAACQWNIPKTAETLGIGRAHLYRKMSLLKITPPPEAMGGEHSLLGG